MKQRTRPGDRTPLRRRRVVPGPMPGVLLLIATACLLLPAGGMLAQDGGVDIENARDALERWVETRRVISAERRDWVLRRESLNDQIDLMQRKIETLREKMAEDQAKIAESDEEIGGLSADNDTLTEAFSALDAAVVGLEARVKTLLRRLPEPTLERVQTLRQALPDDSNDTKLSLTARFLTIVGILNEVTRFNREITVTTEVRTLPDGTSAEVAALYIGLGQAYYVTSNGDAAGVGTATDEGWVWTPADEAAPEVAKAVAIFRNEQLAEFVRLPIKINDMAGDAP